jgi:DNA-binding MarR family transcriptional regulator
MMERIRAVRKGLKKRTIASESAGDMHFTVIGKKRLFGGCSYTVLISTNEKRFSMLCGSFDDVACGLKGNGDREGGMTLLRKTAEVLSDPKRTLTRDFSDTELLCMALLKDGPLSVDDVSDAIRMEKETTSVVLGGLYSEGIVRKCRRRGDPSDGYYLTRKGKRKAELLEDERDFILKQNSKDTI